MTGKSLASLCCLVVSLLVTPLFSQQAESKTTKFTCEACDTGQCTICSMEMLSGFPVTDLDKECCPECDNQDCSKTNCSGADCTNTCDCAFGSQECQHPPTPTQARAFHGSIYKQVRCSCGDALCTESPLVGHWILPMDNRQPDANHAADDCNPVAKNSPPQTVLSVSQARAQLAKQLAEYLHSAEHDPEHVHNVLRMALEMTAENAQLAALAAQKTALNRESMKQKAEQSLRHMRYTFARNQDDMRELLAEMQSGLFALSKTVKEIQDQANQNRSRSPGRATKWSSTPVSYHLTDENRVDHLQQRIRQLENQLQALQSRDPTQSAWGSVALRPLNQAAQPLEPIRHLPRPLTPKSPSYAKLQNQHHEIRSYYVADLLVPPFPNSALQLVKTLKANVDPASWEDATIEIAGPAISLVISQTPQNHQRIVKLLESFNQDTSWVTGGTHKQVSHESTDEFKYYWSGER